MKPFIYTPENEVKDEIEIISQLLDMGADHLYIRKPNLDDFSLVDYMESIPEKYWKRCISTSLIITKEFDLGGYHFTRDVIDKNQQYNDMILEWIHDKNKIASISAHSMDEIKRYAGKYDHLIVSPLFKSISKQDHQYKWDYEKLRITNYELRFNSKLTRLPDGKEIQNSKLFAVGGVDLTKISEIKAMNFDGIGLLGALWSEPEKAAEKFKEIKMESRIRSLDS